MGACVSVSTSSGFLKKTKRKKSINGCNSRSSSTHHDPSSKDSKKNKKNKNRSSSSSIMVLKDGVANHDHSLFDKYEFGKELGKGEFGITYKCTNKETGEKVACKRISKCKLRTEIDVEDVRREVEIMQKLPKHPNIVSYKDVYEDKDAIYLIMELCEGGELFERIVAKGHFTERDAANVIKTVMEVVKVCHKHGVIHRDLKPENFLYKDPSEDAPLKAIDFGLSTFFKPGQRFREIVGSPYYMASEVLKRNYGAEIDVWSAGIILYILLCGTPPFFAETEEEIAHAIVKGEVDFKREPWHRISGNAKDLVKGMLEHNPYTRLSVQEVLDHPWLQNMDAVSTVPLGEQVQARIKQFSLMNKFKKRVLRVVAGNLPDHEVDKIKQMFHVMDTNKNGILSFDELKVGINKFVQPMTDPDVRLLLNTADADGNGSLDMEEFVTMAVHLKRVETNDELLGQAFKFFDKDQSGYIEFEDLRESLKEENNGPNNEQVVQDIIFDADLNKDGKISYDEFKAMMTTGIDWKMASRQYSRAKLQALSVKIFKDKSMQA